MASFHEYDPDQVVILFAGIPLSGFADDEMISYEEDEDAFTVKKGVDGAITRVKNLGQVVEITVKLMQTSRSNAVLSALHEQDRLQPGGAGVAPFGMQDGNGTSLFATDKCWIAKRPPVSYGKDVGPREWKFHATNYAWFEGGT